MRWSLSAVALATTVGLAVLRLPASEGKAVSDTYHPLALSSLQTLQAGDAAVADGGPRAGRGRRGKHSHSHGGDTQAGYVEGTISQMLGSRGQMMLFQGTATFADFGALANLEFLDRSASNHNPLGYTIRITEKQCTKRVPSLLQYSEEPTDGCKLLHWEQERCFSFINYPFLITTRWSVNQTCSTYDLLKSALAIGATGVVVIAPPCDSPGECNANKAAILSRRQPSNQPNIELPLVMLSAADGDALVRNSWLYDPEALEHPVWARLSAPDSEKQYQVPRNMFVMTITAPLVIFSMLCLARMFRRPTHRRYERVRNQYRQARADALTEFVEGLPLCSFSEWAMKAGAAGAAPSGAEGAAAVAADTEPLVPSAGDGGHDDETCPICIDGFEPADEIRDLPCPCRYVYHKVCIDPWLLENGTCPTCKHVFVAEPTLPAELAALRGILVHAHEDQPDDSEEGSSDDSGGGSGSGSGSDTDSADTDTDDEMLAYEEPGSTMGRRSQNAYVDDESSSSDSSSGGGGGGGGGGVCSNNYDDDGDDERALIPDDEMIEMV